MVMLSADSRWTDATCSRARSMVVFLAIGLGSLGGTTVSAGQDPNQAAVGGAKAAGLEATIAGWIEQLGDGQYATREKAQAELRKLGTAAFDQLLAAQDHTDVEIAQRARYLVRSIHVHWTKESDPLEVKSFLANFGELGRNERRTRAQHLATLANGIGVEPLCRIVRFESDRILSKHAALLIMSLAPPDDPEQRRARAAVIREGVASSTRPAIEWLLTYARELEQPHSTLGDWERITKQELATLAKNPQQSDRVVARDLVRWQTQRLLDLDRNSEAMANFRRTFDLIDDEPADIYEAIDWAIEHQLYGAPGEIAANFQSRVRSDPRLLYRLAEAQLKSGEEAAAEQTAAEARRANPGRFDDHLATAEVLYRRGLVEWSAAEYRAILAAVKLESEQSLEARDHLSRMLVDIERENEAADIVQPLVEYAEKEPKPNDVMQMINHYFRGNMHYWRGLHFARLGDREQQVAHFDKAIEASPENIDILIAMYRVPNPDAEWKRQVQEKIDAHLGQCRGLITKSEEIIRRQPNFEGAASDPLAKAYNELAWLISNTSGDFQEAVRASERSLQLSPNNEAYLDTLGRCHFAAGNLEKAVQFQRRAVAAAPHVQIMRRQLAVFEKALADARAKSPTAAAVPPGNDSRSESPVR